MCRKPWNKNTTLCFFLKSLLELFDAWKYFFPNVSLSVMEEWTFLPIVIDTIQPKSNYCANKLCSFESLEKGLKFLIQSKFVPQNKIIFFSLERSHIFFVSISIFFNYFIFSYHTYFELATLDLLFTFFKS